MLEPTNKTCPHPGNLVEVLGGIEPKDFCVGEAVVFLTDEP